MDIGKDSWGAIIGNIRKHINDRTNKMPTELEEARDTKKKLRQHQQTEIEEIQRQIDRLTQEKLFLEACAQPSLELKYFTTEWRNHVAHGRANYTTDEARRVLEHVGTFMKHIVSDLDLKQVD